MSDNVTNRFIPAWAGNTAYTLIYTLAHPVHPRVGGEHTSSNLLICQP